MTERLPYIPPTIVTDTLDEPTLRAGARNVAESNRPREGYPGLIPGYRNTRLFMEREAILAATTTEEVWPLSDGTLTKISRIELPPGHDTESPGRKEFLSSPKNVENLIYPPTPDIMTGSDDQATDEEFQRWLDSGFRVFDQHNRVLPGTYERIVQLLGLRALGATGNPLGMPTGNGTFSGPGVHPAGDPFILMHLPKTNDFATLVWGHPPNDQSHEVWVPPGGFGSREDITEEGTYSSWQTAVRLSNAKVGFDISEFEHHKVHEEFALSSPTTINAALAPEGHLVAVPYSQEIATKIEYEIPTGEAVSGAQWLSVKALIKLNTALRRAGMSPDFDHRSNPDHVYWDTHMRGFIKAVNKYRSLIRGGV